MIEQLLQYDKELFLFLNGLGTETWDGFWMFITTTRNSAPLYLLLLYLSYRTFGWKGTGIILVSIALLIPVPINCPTFLSMASAACVPATNPK